MKQLLTVQDENAFGEYLKRKYADSHDERYNTSDERYNTSLWVLVHQYYYGKIHTLDSLLYSTI